MILRRLIKKFNFQKNRIKFSNAVKSTFPVRHNCIKLDESLFKSFFEEVEVGYQGVNSTYLCISAIWKEILDGYSVNIFQDIYSQDIPRLMSAYENYYAEGISDGASSGVALNNSKFLKEKNIRNHLRMVTLFLSQTPINTSDLYEKYRLFDVYDIVLDKIKIPESIFIGRAWCWELPKHKIHFELADYIYFSQICISIISLIQAKNILLLGDGSGVNAALINENIQQDIKLTHVDLAQYLLMQYIVNYKWKDKSKYVFAENFTKTNICNIDLIINMDSFPEMTSKEVEKYVKFVKVQNIKYILSYNHKIIDDRHSNFRRFFLEAGMCTVISYESSIRKGWFVELFKLV